MEIIFGKNKRAQSEQNKMDELVIIKTEDGEGFIGGDLKLGKKIAYGIFGVIYETVLVSDESVKYATKLMPSAVKENINEVRVNKFVTEVVNQKMSKHFLTTHQVCIVDHPDLLDKPDKKKKHFMVVNELAQGDLKALIAGPLLQASVLFNICVQSLLSIMTLHSYGFIHNDCHYGNFLFKVDDDVPDDGYYQYVIYGTDYYLKACKYNMMIYDFGLTIKNDDSGLCHNLGIEDYRRVLPSFMLHDVVVNAEKEAFGLIESTDKTLRPLSTFCKSLYIKLFRDIKTDAQKKQTIPVAQYVVSELLSAPGMKDVFTDSLPEGGRVINDSNPFIITEEKSKEFKKMVPRLLKIAKK